MLKKIMETLENLEDRIEKVKWLVVSQLTFRKSSIDKSIDTIRKSSGILSKGSPKGPAFESRIRKEWSADSLKRAG